MAYYSKVHLKDAASEAFLSSRGFVLIASCSQLSNWICDSINLFFPIDSTFHSDIDIYKAIALDYSSLGFQSGKRSALTAITNSLSAVVFPKKN